MIGSIKIDKDDINRVKSEISRAFKDGGSFYIEFKMLNNQKNYIWVECVGGVVQRNENNKAIQACGILRDINQKKLNEKRVQDQELLIHNQAKVEAIAEMLKNISHQWKQPLSAITTLASSIKLSYELDKPMKDEELLSYSDKILENGNYLAKIVNDFSSYFDNNTQQKETYKLTDIFSKIYNAFKGSEKAENIVCKLSINEDITLHLNENFFIQAILNILNNSIDAFITQNIDNDKRYIFIEAKSVDEDVEIEIKDSAGGINEAIISKVFEPYFTTKHQSLGTGLGLYMTNQIIHKHLTGIVEVKNIDYIYENIELKGTQFKIIIPSS